MITSKSNELIKHCKALSQKKYRDAYSEYMVEGIKIVEEAIQEKQEILHLIVSENLQSSFPNQEKEVVSESVFSYLSETKTPQGVIAIVKKPNEKAISCHTVFALDRVQDPGNVGTIIRTLDAAGLHDLIVSYDSADIYNPKVVRSTMGGIFRVNVMETSHLACTIQKMKQEGYQVVVTSLLAEKFIYDIDFRQKLVIIIGNESQGVSPEIIQVADQKVKIPMPGKAESLNASVAASIIAYEAVRQSL